MTRYLYVVLAAASIATAQHQDPAGWTTARWGMTADQVRAAIPDAVPIPPEKIDGRPATLGIPHLDIGRSTWTAYFLFDPDGRLDAVHLKALGTSVSQAAFVDTELLLSERYGRSIARHEENNRSAQWSFPKTAITLRYTNLAPRIRFETLWLSYTVPPSSRL